MAKAGKDDGLTPASRAFYGRRGRDEGEEGEREEQRERGRPQGRERVLGTLPPPADGWTYKLARDEGGGGIKVIHCLDDGGTIQANEGDNRQSWSDARTRSLLHRMNLKNRAAARDRATSSEKTLFKHYPGPGERLELRQDPRMQGQWVLMLVTGTAKLVGEMPAGSEPRENNEEEDLKRPHATSARTGIVSGAGTSDHRAPMTLARLNALHRQYWNRNRAA